MMKEVLEYSQVKVNILVNDSDQSSPLVVDTGQDEAIPAWVNVTSSTPMLEKVIF
jgi:hypothetical protein